MTKAKAKEEENREKKFTKKNMLELITKSCLNLLLDESKFLVFSEVQYFYNLRKNESNIQYIS